MGFESHPVVKEHLKELKRITEVREQLRLQLAKTWELAQKTNNDVERQNLTKTARDLEQQVSTITSKGELYMLKIDQLNGVR